MNTIIKLAGAGIVLLAIAKIVSAEGTGNITATNITTDKSACAQTPCTVSGSVTWKNAGTEAASFVPKLVSGTGALLASHPEQTLQAGEEHIMDFSVQITEETKLCPLPN